VITYTPSTRSDFALVSGELSKTEEHVWHNPPSVSPKKSEEKYRDFKIAGDSLTYRVSINQYNDYFKREEFLEEVKLGVTIEFDVHRDHPVKHILGQEIRFVNGVRVGDKSYLSLDHYLTWHAENNRNRVICAILFSVFATVFLGLGIMARKVPRDAEKSGV